MGLVASTDWPSVLGSPTVDGSLFAKTPQFRRTETGMGVARYRRKAVRLPSKMELSFWFRDDQFAIFENFYYGTTGAGFNAFNIALQTSYGQVAVVIKMGPYTARYMDIMAATQVTFEAIFNQPPFRLTAATVASRVFVPRLPNGQLAVNTTGPGLLALIVS